MIFRGYYEKKLEVKYLTIDVIEKQHLPYWKLVNDKENYVIVPQTRSRSSPIHHHIGVNLYDMNSYVIL